MNARVFLAPLLAGAIGVFALPGKEQPPSKPAVLPKLNQLREGESEQPLAALMGRCRTMLDAQIAVHNSTKGLYKVIEGTADKKPRPEHRQSSRKLAANEKLLGREAAQVINQLEAEGAAVAFSEFFRHMRNDMKRVQRRLKVGDVGIGTQAIEQDIIDALREMLASLEKR